MSITGALSNALSGLGAASRAAEVVSSNVANAMTEGYGRRTLEVAARTNGSSGGVRVVSVERHMSQAVLDDRRAALAGLADSDARTGFLSRLSDSYGVPGSGTSMADDLSRLAASLVSASARPDSPARLEGSVDALRTLSERINLAQRDIQSARGRADAAIANDVSTLNAALQRIEILNNDIRKHGQGDSLAAGLRDERQRLIDQVAQIVPVREIDRGDGRVALMTPRGTMLIDGPAARLGFTQVNMMTPDLDVGVGTLSGITVNGRPVDLSLANHALSGGSLGGHLAVRDQIAPEAQAELDAFARDLVERFQDPAADPSLAPGDAGLFTDAGVAFDPANEVGLAGRLAINAAVDPAAGGAAWRLRDGIGALAPGDAGQSAGLDRLSAALSAARPVASGPMAGISRTSATLLSDVMSSTAGALVLAEADTARAGARADVLTDRLLANGVDTDEEMQKLLLIEQAYGANARVIETVQDMIDALMRI
jgi:flagellar hook-associated protein 1 FlgK